MTGDRRIDRKSFFTEGPRSLFRAFLEGMEESARRPAAAPAGIVPRPPGAIRETEFLEICTGGGDCARVCPADAIRMLPRHDDPSKSAPLIQPELGACVICNDLSCMAACPSGALRPVARNEIRIGTARVSEAECFAWSNVDSDCRDCVENCPVGSGALRTEEADGRLGPVLGPDCVGCGVCEYLCPVYPAAIRVFAREGA